MPYQTRPVRGGPLRVSDGSGVFAIPSHLLLTINRGPCLVSSSRIIVLRLGIVCTREHLE